MFRFFSSFASIHRHTRARFAPPVQVANMQVDNMLWMPRYPVILAPKGVPEGRAFLHVSVSKSMLHPNMAVRRSCLMCLPLSLSAVAVGA